MISLSIGLEQAQARAALLEKDLEEARAEIELPKRGRAGVTVTALGTHTFNTQEVLKKVVEIETIRASKKRKGKAKEVALASPEPEEEDPFTRAS
jgi:hypothetical protein